MMSLSIAIALTLLSTIANVAAKTEPAAPDALVGTWDVERVEADRQDQMHWDIHPGDPRLMGRTLDIAKDSVSFSPEMDRCTQKAWRALVAPWTELFTKGFSRAPMGGRSAHPKPADFGFTVPNPGAATAYLLCPGKKTNDEWMVATWVSPTSADTLIMHRDAQVLLVLKRRPASEKPRASFPCEKASSPTEKALCKSFDLASWDRSVALSYKSAVSRNRGQQAKLRDEQKAWLKERDACKNDDCILNALRDRVDDLLKQADYGP